MAATFHCFSQRLHNRQTWLNAEDSSLPGCYAVWLGEWFPEMTAPQNYTTENTAKFHKILVRTQNVTEVTVAPLVQGTQRNILNKFPSISHSAHKLAIHFQYTVHQLSSSTGLITLSNVSSLVYFQQGYQRSNNNLKKQAELVTLFCIKYIQKEHDTRKCIFRRSQLTPYFFIY
jgi:hypothetical protein